VLGCAGPAPSAELPDGAAAESPEAQARLERLRERFWLPPQNPQPDMAYDARLSALPKSDVTRVDRTAAALLPRVAHFEGVAVTLRLVAGTLEFLPADGDPRLHVMPPRLVDAGGVTHPAALAVEGCAVDANPAAPWGRAVVPPGARACRVVVRWDVAVRYPILV